MINIEEIINAAFDHRKSLGSDTPSSELTQAVATTIDRLDSGKLRVAQNFGGDWLVNHWVKKAVLLSFRLSPNVVSDGVFTRYYDKMPLKYVDYDEKRFIADGARIVPHALVRKGAFVSPDVVLMPCYVNIGAWIGPGTMVDTWATIGSCAQIGSNVHISGGAGIGGVLEPVQAAPTIIEDDCFIGARSEIVEGVIVEQGAVISMGVFIGQSTRIYDRERDQVSYGRIPAGAVVVPGSLPADNGKYQLACAVIVKRVDAKTRGKIGINELLRNIK